MLNILLDENFNGNILRALLLKKPDLDYLRVQDIPQLYSQDDPDVLEWAAKYKRVLFTHDVNTIPAFAYDRVKNGLPMSGVFEVSQTASIGDIVDDMLLVIEAFEEGDWDNHVSYIPLK